TLPCPIPPGQRHRLQGVRLAGPAPLPEAAVTVQRRGSSPGCRPVARPPPPVGATPPAATLTVATPDHNIPPRVVGPPPTPPLAPGTTADRPPLPRPTPPPRSTR